MNKPETAETPSSASDPSTWVDNYGDVLYRFALARLSSPAIAEDFVQETFLTALKKVNTFEGRSSFQTWLITILRNKIIDHMRRSGREVPVEDLDTSPESVESKCFSKMGIWKVFVPNWGKDPDKTLENKDFYRVFQLCVSKLPEKHRLAFTSKVLKDMDKDEICKALDISPSNYWVILYRARMSLRECLESNWFEKKD